MMVMVLIMVVKVAMAVMAEMMLFPRVPVSVTNRCQLVVYLRVAHRAGDATMMVGAEAVGEGGEYSGDVDIDEDITGEPFIFPNPLVIKLHIHTQLARPPGDLALPTLLAPPLLPHSFSALQLHGTGDAWADFRRHPTSPQGPLLLSAYTSHSVPHV